MQNANSANVAPDTAQGAARARPRGSVPRRARAVHDGDGALRRHPAAGHHVPRTRRHLLRPRSHAPDGRAEAGRATRQARPNSFVVRELGRRLGASHPSFAMSDAELLDDGLRRALASHRWPRWPRSAGSIARCPSRVRISSTASRRPTASSTSSRTGRRSGRATRACRPSPTGRPTTRRAMPSTPTSWCARRRATSSTPPSPRRRPRSPGRAARSCGSTPTRPRDSALERACPRAHRQCRGSVVLKAALDAGQQAATLIVEGIWPATPSRRSAPSTP